MKAEIIFLYVLVGGLIGFAWYQQTQINKLKPATPSGHRESNSEDPNKIVYGADVYDKVMANSNTAGQREIKIVI